jgi:integrase
MRARIGVSWKTEQITFNIQPILHKYEDYLKSKGYMESSITRYLDLVKVYINANKNIRPTPDDAFKFRADLLKSNRKRATINLYSAAIRQFHKMNGEEVELPYLKVNNKLPYCRSQDDILKILSIIPNFKHYTIISLCFYCMLRASELINLNDCDIDLKGLTLRVHEGKGGKDAVLPINPGCCELLRQYLQIRPKIILADGSIPVFPTDYLNRWDQRDLYRMFTDYKKKAGIGIPGGTHLLL